MSRLVRMVRLAFSHMVSDMTRSTYHAAVFTGFVASLPSTVQDLYSAYVSVPATSLSPGRLVDVGISVGLFVLLLFSVFRTSTPHSIELCQELFPETAQKYASRRRWWQLWKS